jgi:hypothetical protein
VSVMCCQVEVSATSWSLVQRSPTDCGVSLCDLETLWVRRPWPTGGYNAKHINKRKIQYTKIPFHLCTQLLYKELSTFYYLTLLHHA